MLGEGMLHPTALRLCTHKHLVMVMYTKTAGKNSRQEPVAQTSNICALSRIAIKVHENMYGRRFSPFPSETSGLQTFQFLHLHSHQILTLVNQSIVTDAGGFVELPQSEWEVFKDLERVAHVVVDAMKAFGSRRR